MSETLERSYDPRLKALSPDLVAETLHMALSDVARVVDVHRNTLARTPTSPKVQAGLGMIMRILTDAAELMGGDVGRASVWFRHQPLAGFDHQTAEELVTAGRGQAVLKHLAMLRDGGYA
jgi:hypothetical protein